jgi:TolB-like protein/Tfp pilus assembly protein PilF
MIGAPLKGDGRDRDRHISRIIRQFPEWGSMRKLIEELMRRNVIRVGIAYLVAAWVLLQFADLVLENIGAPAWVMQALMLVLVLGLPPVLLFSWVFELTPEGLRREKDIAPGESITRHTAHRLDRLTVGLLIVVVLIVAAERLIPAGDAPEPAPATAIDKSIAVLAFHDLSPAGDQGYFAEGISEELLNVLAQIPDLKVAGRTSSFAFKDQNRDLREIGEILEVAHILEGSVRTSGDRIRVTAQLVKADDGFHLFSRNYDRKLTDIFEVQDDIAREIATALRSAILGDRPVEKATPTPVEAYERYLQARQSIHSRDRELMEEAVVLLDEALAIDPDYAPAMAQKALTILLLSNADGAYGDIPVDVSLRESRPLIDKALEHDPDLAEAHAILGLWYSNGSATSSEQAIASLRRALAINPAHANASNWLANELAGAEHFNESTRLYETVIDRDPLYRPAFNNLIFRYMATRSLDRGESLLRRVERITGESPNVIFARGALAMANGQLAAAAEELARAYEYNSSASVVQTWYGTALLNLGDYETAIEIARSTNKLVPMELAGRHEEASELFDSLEGLIYDEGTLRGIGDWMLMRERPDELIAFLEQLAGEGKDWLAEQPRPTQLWGAAHLTNVAYALRATGRGEEAQRVLSETKEILDKQAEYGANNMYYWWNKAEYAALTGDVETMLGSLRKTIDTGLYGTAGFYSVAFNRYRGDARFIELEREAIRRANEERKKLGMLQA